MKIFAFASILGLTFVSLIVGSNPLNSIEKSEFYSVYSTNDMQRINQMLKKLATLTFHEKDAYSAALLMKKAGLITPVKQKLSLFSEGKPLLEKCITKDNNNGEYRFLRLSIQENCPAILNYSSNINEDKSLIIKQFSGFNPDLQSAILQYCKLSKNLNEKELR